MGSLGPSQTGHHDSLAPSSARALDSSTIRMMNLLSCTSSCSSRFCDSHPSLRPSPELSRWSSGRISWDPVLAVRPVRSRTGCPVNMAISTSKSIIPSEGRFREGMCSVDELIHRKRFLNRDVRVRSRGQFGFRARLRLRT